MSRVPLLEMDEIPESHHHLFTDEYLGDRWRQTSVRRCPRV
ncbi:hypothetical protein [Halorientalis sp. IM1011]|nr:hypothetical protein [Halorientalis sp. IM1011]